jgi:hypothetical protein
MRSATRLRRPIGQGSAGSTFRVPSGTVSHAAQYPTARYPTRHGIPRGAVSRMSARCRSARKFPHVSGSFRTFPHVSGSFRTFPHVSGSFRTFPHIHSGQSPPFLSRDARAISRSVPAQMARAAAAEAAAAAAAAARRIFGGRATRTWRRGYSRSLGTAPTSAPGLRPRLRRDCAHVCAGT